MTTPAHVHPLTPVIQAVTTIPGIVTFIFIAFTAGGLAINNWLLLVGLGAVIAVPIIVGIVGFFTWRRLTYWFDDDGDFRVDSGIIFRQQRRVQLSRIQAVDVTQPLIARLMGFAAITIEVAGMQDSRVKLAYFPLQQGKDLRAEIIARAAGMRPDVGEAPEAVISTVSPRQLLISLLLRTSTVLLIALTIAILVFTVLSEGWGGLAIALTTGSLPIVLVVVEFMLYYGFTITTSPDGLRLTSGLLQKQTRTIPPGRIQAIDIVEPFLWRRRGWARIRINIAGVGTDDSNSQRRETLLTPVASWEHANELIHRVLPGFPLDDLPWVPVPKKVRWRSPIQWRFLATAEIPSEFCVRRGRITRHLIIIPHVRCQSVRVTQGPWERALGLATMHMDTTKGPVTVAALHQPIAEAQRLARVQVEYAKRGRQRDHSTRWMQPRVPDEPLPM
jgi:putative membrane protein